MRCLMKAFEVGFSGDLVNVKYVDECQMGDCVVAIQLRAGAEVLADVRVCATLSLNLLQSQ